MPGRLRRWRRLRSRTGRVVSNVAPVHLEFFADGIAGIARAKYELVEALPQDGVAVLNFDDDVLRRSGEGWESGRFSTDVNEGRGGAGGDVAEVGAEGVVFTVEAQGERAERAVADAGAAQRSQCAGGDCGGAAERHVA